MHLYVGMCTMGFWFKLSMLPQHIIYCFKKLFLESLLWCNLFLAEKFPSNMLPTDVQFWMDVGKCFLTICFLLMFSLCISTSFSLPFVCTIRIRFLPWKSTITITKINNSPSRFLYIEKYENICIQQMQE